MSAGGAGEVAWSLGQVIGAGTPWTHTEANRGVWAWGGEREDLALQSGTALIGWTELSDLSHVDTREQVRELLAKAYPDSKPNTITTWTGQLWAFLRRIQANDLVILPLKKRSAIRFKGHDLERLVSDVLRAMGYQTQLPPQGADAGVDVIAGRGSMGFDPPRLCVQVKSGTEPIDVRVLHELQGVMKNFGAEQGLLVSWGGFKSSVINEARKSYFSVRLWTADDLVDAILDNYERLPDTLQAELPLKRIWTLVQEEDLSDALR